MTDRADLIGSHPQPFRYYLALGIGTFRTGLDLAMLVAGSGLLGLAIAVLLDGFEVVDLALDSGIGASLGSALVIGVCGGFALGIASEGRYGTARPVDGFPTLEVALGRILSIGIMSVVLLWVAGRLDPVLAELPYQFAVAVAVVRAVGATGLVAALLGVPAAWGIRRGLDRLGWGSSLEIPTLYLIWLVAALITFSTP
jgi:hypothetical protein